MIKNLKQILGNFPLLSRHGREDTLIRSLTYDSRRVEQDSVFFAQVGLHSDGHAFIPKVIEMGASVIVHTKELENYADDVAYVRVDDIKSAMSYFSHEFYDRPSHKLKVIGVTGTDGKSSSVFYLYQILNKLGRKAGFISTVAYDAGEGIQNNPYHQSTPESTEIQAILGQMVESDVEFAVVESTSHGLSLKHKRLEDVRFDSALLTNISEEHLDFHGTLDAYVADKTRLFQKAKKGMVNASCAFAEQFEGQKADCSSYGLKVEADYKVTEIDRTADGQYFDLVHTGKTLKGFLPVPGAFNIENVTGAVSLLHWAYSIPLADSIEQLGSIEQPAGRVELVKGGQDFPVIVDFAHTPGSFSRLLPAMREQTNGKLIVVFGCAGERYAGNRPLMGKLASEWADLVILTDDEPRSEEPAEITRQIAVGIGDKMEGIDLFIINDRAKAIDFAIAGAEPADCVLILGKGHETSLIYADREIAWSDRESAEESLAKRFN